ncbi:MAG: DinB family protein [Bacteroidota bacterium]
MSADLDADLGDDLGDDFAVLRQTRRSLVAVVDALTPAERVTVPDGFNNHILWNAGHLAVTEQLLVYGLSDLPIGVPDEMVAGFRKGTSPRDWERAWAWDEIRQALLARPDQTEADWHAGRFTSFREYRTTPGVVLRSVEDALRFNLYHEGIHLGSILALRRLVS